MKEILNTEINYVEDLNDLLERVGLFFFPPLVPSLPFPS